MKIKVNGEVFDLGDSFLGFSIKVKPKRILLISEEPPWVWTTRPKINWEVVDVIQDFEALVENWEELEGRVANKQWDLLILDSLDCLLEGFKVSDENSAAEVNKALRRLMQLARVHKVAVLVIDHLRKSSEAGNLTEVRGSGAKIGRSDVIITLTAKESAPNQRVLRAWSRFPLPKALVGSGLIIEMEDGKYKTVGIKSAMRESEWEAQLAELVELVPQTPTKFSELLAVASMSERTLRRKLEEAVKGGMVDKPMKGFYQRK